MSGWKAEMIEQLQMRRRHERRLIDRAALGSEPILFDSEVARRLVCLPHSVHEHGVHATDKQ
jgi:hypothetical protein